MYLSYINSPVKYSVGVHSSSRSA